MQYNQLLNKVKMNQTVTLRTDKRYKFHQIVLIKMVFWLQIGPIPVEDSLGKELVIKLTTPLRTNKTFYTDSNGRDFLKRVGWDRKILMFHFIK